MRGTRQSRRPILTRRITRAPFAAVAVLACAVALTPAAAAAAGGASRTHAARSAGGVRHTATTPYTYNWPEMHRSPALDGYTPNTSLSTANASQLGVKWAANLQGAALDSPVVAYNATLNATLAYIGTEHGYLIAVNIATGRIVWGTWLGGAIRATPVVSDGSVYVGTFNSARVYRVNAATGAVQCSVSSPQPIEGTPVVATPPGGTRTVYVGTNDSISSSGPVLAVNAASCKLDWAFTRYAKLSGSWTPVSYAVDGSNVPVILFGSADPDSRVYAVNAVTGTKVWQYAVDNPPPHVFDVGAGVTVVPPGAGDKDGIVYVPSKYGYMYALDLTTGAKIWSFNVNATLNAREGGRSTAALDGTNLVFGYSHGLVDLDTAHNPNPATMAWHWADPAGAEVLSSPAIAGPSGQEIVAAGDLGGGFDVLSLAGGTPLYRYQTAGYVTASPAVSNGNIIIASSDGFLYDFAAGGGNETTLPSTSVTSPKDFSSVPNPNGRLTLSGTASDATGVTGVEVAVQEGGSNGSWWDAATRKWTSGPVGNPAKVASQGATSSTWSFSYPVPPGGGTYAVTATAVSATGQADVKGGHARFSVLATTTGPHLAASSRFVPPGGAIRVSGGGFGTSEKVSISLQGTTVATATTTSTGALPRTRVVIPRKAAFGLSSLLATGQTSGKSATAAITVANRWDEAGYGAAHTGFEPNDSTLMDLVHIGPNLFLDPSWQYQSGNSIATAPAIADAIAYTGNTAGQLAAIDVYNGAPLWAKNITSATIGGSPAVDPSKGRVFAGADNGSLYARKTASGNKAWTTRLAGTAGNVSAPVYGSGEVYATSSTGTVEAVSESGGVKKWARLLGTAITAAPSLDSSGGRLIVAESGGKGRVLALNPATGKTIWAFTTGGAVAAPAVISGGVVYVGSADKSVYALSVKTGKMIWSHQTGGAIAATPVITNQGTPGGELEVLAGSSNGTLYALKASDGSPIFQVIYGAGNPITGVAAVRGVAIVSTSSGMIGGNRTYSKLRVWEYQTGTAISAPPAIVDGTVYTGSGNGKLYAFTTYGQLPSSMVRWPG